MIRLLSTLSALLALGLPAFAAQDVPRPNVVDPGETTDLSGERPEILAEMLAAFSADETEVGVLPMPPGYNSRDAVVRNATERHLANNPGPIALVLGVLLALLYGLWRAARAIYRAVRR